MPDRIARKTIVALKIDAQHDSPLLGADRRSFYRWSGEAHGPPALSRSAPNSFAVVAPVDCPGAGVTDGGLGSDWPDHRSSNFGACPVVSATGAPVVSGARVLTSGSVAAGDRSGDVACEDAGAPGASCCTGICSCADAAA